MKGVGDSWKPNGEKTTTRLCTDDTVYIRGSSKHTCGGGRGPEGLKRIDPMSVNSVDSVSVEDTCPPYVVKLNAGPMINTNSQTHRQCLLLLFSGRPWEIRWATTRTCVHRLG